MKNIRVLSYNIHKGFGSRNREFNLPRVREALRQLNPDLILLQEVQGTHNKNLKKVPGWPATSQHEFLAMSIWPHFTYGKNAVYIDGDHGNAILSRFPILESQNLNISQNRFEKRGMLHALIKIEGRQSHFHAICTHLDLLAFSRKKQIEMISQKIQNLIPRDESLILGGDFNDWHKAIQLPLDEAFLKRYGSFARTFPARMPLLPLDRLYFRGFEVQSAKVLKGEPWSFLSDHAPILVELKIN